MNQNHQDLIQFIESSSQLSDEEKSKWTSTVKAADKALTIAEFKLERTEKVKRTTAILLEETIQELEQKRKSIEDTNKALNQSLKELKDAQAQLIQAEKMASLGELTAGIAHEIQNPLNFVNNFSEVSRELLDEMKEELEAGNLEDVKEIADDVIQNLKKITHHGERADSIVKGMLQHSRANKGEKESVNINTLVDEYLRLAYHGFRAKNKSLNLDLNTEYHEELPDVPVVPQDLGRVILNIINNAFYAVNEKNKEEIEGYKPKVTIQTSTTTALNGRKIDDTQDILINIEDNGNGIPKGITKKIFQPFFTTKPTGQGTGLGLSLSYDIIKAHGGELKVKSTKQGGTKFTIVLPIT